LKRVKVYHLMTAFILLLILSACANQEQLPNSEQDTPELSEKRDEEGEETEEEALPTERDHAEEDLNRTLFNIEDDESITSLVNKINSLEESYVPADLVTVNVPTVLENPEVNQLREEAALALEEMFAAAKESEVYLHARSGYRSYETQVQLFNGYVERHGEEEANRYSAKPGYSEHQTGLVMDVTSESVALQLDEKFGETIEGEWLKEHAHEYGFLIRYPEGMEEITGYIYEPWHLRYFGEEVATLIVESGLTYEEFLVEEGILHEVDSKKTE